MAVNISGRQLVDPGFASSVAKVLAYHGLPPGRLCLEITETTLNGEAGDVEATLAALSDQGVQLAIDDYGTGYSTLAHLHRLKVDILKIDRSFIEQIGRTARDTEIIAAITAMSHALGMTVVGEGIATSRAARRAHRARVRHRPGLPLHPPAPGRRDRRVPERRDTAPRVGSALARRRSRATVGCSPGRVAGVR